MFDLLQILFAFHHCFKVCFQFYPSGGKCVPKLGICFCVDLGSFELSFATKTSTICLADRIFLLKTSQVSATPQSFSNCSFISLHIRPIVSATSQSWLSKTKPKGIFTRHNWHIFSFCWLKSNSYAIFSSGLLLRVVFFFRFWWSSSRQSIRCKLSLTTTAHISFCMCNNWLIPPMEEKNTCKLNWVGSALSLSMHPYNPWMLPGPFSATNFTRKSVHEWLLAPALSSVFVFVVLTLLCLLRVIMHMLFVWSAQVSEKNVFTLPH